MGDCQARGGPFLLTACDRGCNFILDARSCIVGIVMIEVGFDVLGMITVTVEAFAVVFPNQFPICMDEVIKSGGDLGPGETLGVSRLGKHPMRRRKIDWLIGQVQVNEALDLPSMDRPQPKL